MFQSIKQLYGAKLGAPDGEIGQVKDFYFDDESWAVRYLVADTGTWLSGRQVLISPHSLDRFDQAGKVLRVNLTRQQIENSPSIETHKPVSRQYEEEFYGYYGLPGYWQGDGLWGATGFPILEAPPKSFPAEPTASGGPRPNYTEPHLRSTQAVSGYHLQASDGAIGHVCDYLMDPQNWAIRKLVIKTGHRFSGKEVQIPTNKVERVSYGDSSVYVALTRETIEQSSAPDMAPVGGTR